MAEVNSLLRRDIDPDSDGSDKVGGEGGTEGNQDEWDGIGEDAVVDREAEYLDEDLHTTVTVEAVEVSKDGLHKTYEDGSDEEEDEALTKRSSKDKPARGDESSNGPRTATKTKPSNLKKKKKKFRYESKVERKITKHKERSKNSAQARDRKSS